MPITIPAMVLTGVSSSLEGATVAVAGDVDCRVVNIDDAGVVEDAVDKLVVLAVLLFEASLILK